MLDEKKFIKSTLLIAICTFLSRILGLLRTTLISSFYGATESSGLADCYTASFKLPDIIFTLVISGMVSIVLIPYFLTIFKDHNWDILNKACSGFINFLFLLISFFIIIGLIFTPFIVKNFLLPGWNNETNITITINMTRILFLQVLFITLSSIFGSYLNALEQFKAFSFAILAYNIGIISGIIFFAPLIGIYGLAWGVVFGAFLHFIIQFLGAIKNGFKYFLVFPSFDNELKELIINSFPRVITLSSEQMVRFFFVNIGSTIFIGSILIFDNVESIAMVPYGIVATSISTTAFPIFIKYFNSNDNLNLYNSLFEKLRFLVFMVLPLSIFIYIFKIELIDLLIGYNKYTNKDVILTSNALGFFIFGIPFLSATLVIVKFFYAIRKSFIPMFIAIFSSGLTILLSYLFARSLNISGLSISRTIGYFLQFLILLLFIFIYLNKNKIFSELNFNIFIDIIKISLITLFILIIGLLLNKINFSINQKFNSLLKIILFGFPLALIYFLLSYLLNIPDIKIFLKRETNYV